MANKGKAGIKIFDAETGMPIGLMSVDEFQETYILGGGGNANNCDCEPPSVENEELVFQKP